MSFIREIEPDHVRLAKAEALLKDCIEAIVARELDSLSSDLVEDCEKFLAKTQIMLPPPDCCDRWYDD